MIKLAHLPYIDDPSQFLIAMTPEHHSRHLGQAYSFSTVFEDLATSSSVYIEIKTPSVAHDIAMKMIDVTADKIIRTDFYESPTIATEGTTAIPLIQRNRRKTDTSHIIIYSNPSGVTGGTFLRTLLYGSGSSFTPLHNANNDDNGWQLKPDTTYVIKFTNVGDSTSNLIGVHGLFFEVDI